MIAASQVARITGVSHQHPAFFLKLCLAVLPRLASNSWPQVISMYLTQPPKHLVSFLLGKDIQHLFMLCFGHLSFLFSSSYSKGWVWQYITTIPAVGRLRQEDCKIKASLGYIAGSCLKRRSFVHLLIYFAVVGLELRAYTFSHSTSASSRPHPPVFV
jgi:hypothetical protein